MINWFHYTNRPKESPGGLVNLLVRWVAYIKFIDCRLYRTNQSEYNKAD